MTNIDSTNLTTQQLEYIKIKSDPETRILGLTEKQIAEKIGIHERTLYLWKKIPEIRKAIVKESMLASVDSLPTILHEVYKIATHDIDKEVSGAAKIAALKLWMSCHGFLEGGDPDKDEPKDRAAQSFEDRILALGNKSAGLEDKLGVLDD